MPASRTKNPPSPPSSEDVRVVGIGASAGGLEALTAVLRALPADIPMALLLIQHLDPKRHSMLPELLSKTTKIPVVEAKDSMKVESNRVYVMPSNVNIAILDGHFGLTPRIKEGEQFLPIDTFMRSLADVRKNEAIGVVLSGHSHKPLIDQRNGVLYLNPGSVGPRRFNLPITFALLTIQNNHPEAKIFPLCP